MNGLMEISVWYSLIFYLLRAYCVTKTKVLDGCLSCSVLIVGGK